MMEAKSILLISFLVCILLYSYIGLYISHKYGAKIPWWPSIIKGKDYTLYLIYICYIALLLDATVSIYSKRSTCSHLHCWASFQLPLACA
jgi:hypothetical protein